MWSQLDPKDGHSRGKQTYRCRDCHYRFIPDGNRHYFPEATKRQALDMYAEGTGITAAGRVQGVKPATIFSWVKRSPPGPGVDGVDDPAMGGAATVDGIGPGDFLQRDLDL